MSKIKVRVDLDDVLNKFSEYFLTYHYEKTGEELEWNSWDLHLDSRYGLDIWNHLSDKDFFLNMPVEHNAEKTIEYLDNQSSVFEYMIVSSYYGDDDDVFDNIYRQKSAWLYQYFGERAMKRLILVQGSKEKFPADIYIDDYYRNLVEDGAEEKLKLFYTRPHNKNISVDNEYVLRVSKHDQIRNILRDISFHTDINSYLESNFDV